MPRRTFPPPNSRAVANGNTVWPHTLPGPESPDFHKENATFEPDYSTIGPPTGSRYMAIYPAFSMS
jgi:hypothetical protein